MAVTPTFPSRETLRRLRFPAPVRSLLRMFIALFFPSAFSLGYAYAAARSRRARLIMIPALDILQSVSVLGFLAITATLLPSRGWNR